jgi:hypothetical protein
LRHFALDFQKYDLDIYMIVAVDDFNAAVQSDIINNSKPAIEECRTGFATAKKFQKNRH